MHSFIVFLKASERRLLLQRLNSTSGRIDSVLKKSLPFGIAYHHSGTHTPSFPFSFGLIENQIGLTVDERALIEKAHYQRVICVICCTSTLAAGKLKISLYSISLMLNASFFRREFASAKGYCQIT